MRLADLIMRIPAPRVRGGVNIDVSDVTRELRLARPGVVFVSLPEEQRTNPFSAIAAAQRGASAVICGMGTRLPQPPLPCVQVEDARYAYAQATAAILGHPGEHLEIVKVRGDRGASAAQLIRQILDLTGRRCGLMGSQGCEFEDRWLPRGVADLDAAEVQRHFSRILRGGGGICVVEWTAELETTQAMAPVTPKYTIDATVRSRAVSREVLSHGRLLARGLELGVGGTRFRLECGDSKAAVTVNSPLVGRMQVEDLLIAMEAAMGMGLTMQEVSRVVPKLRPVRGRMEPVRMKQPFGVFVDGARTVRDLARTLKEAREIAGENRVHLVLGLGAHYQSADLEELGRVIGTWANQLWVTADDLEGCEFDALVRPTVDAYEGVRLVGRGCQVTPDRASTIQRAMREVSDGDVLVMTGKGHRRVERAERVVVPFDDLEHAGWALEDLGYGKRGNRRGIKSEENGGVE